VLALLAIRTLYPQITPTEAAEVVLPHHDQGRRAGVPIAIAAGGDAGSQ
jgi:hypothetical protein